MPAPPLPPDRVAEVEAAFVAEGGNLSRTAARARVDRGTAARYVRLAIAAGRLAPAGAREALATPDVPIAEPAAAPERTYREDGDEATLEFATTAAIRTLDDVLRESRVDARAWYVESWQVSYWSVPMRVRQGEEAGTRRKLADRPIQTQQARVQVRLRRVMPRPFLEAADAVFERLGGLAPPPPPRPAPRGGERHLAVFGLFDAHFGKLAWRREAGEDYDLKVAESVYRNAVEDLVAECAHRDVGEVLFPVGNDLFHVDNASNTTTSGTPQDVDGRYAKIVEAVEVAVIGAVERMRGVAPVRVLYVPGNHDYYASYHLARTLRAYYRDAADVAVDCEPTSRKYHRYGVNLIGMTHGNNERVDSLPGLMANERPDVWGATTCREWLIGHLHQSKKWVTKPTDTRDAMAIRVLSSLAGTDAWHHRKGFVSTTHAAEVYWYGERSGYRGHAIAPARLDAARGPT